MTIALALATMLSVNSPDNQTRTISVSGNADVFVAPDIAQLLLAVETSDKTIAKAKSATDDKIAKVLAVAQKLGIDAKDTKTDRINIEPYYDDSTSYRPRPRTPDGYTVRRSLLLTVRDMKHFEDVLTAVLDAGINRVEGTNFQTSELRKHRDTARSMALKAAREKATAMAGELGMKIGKPLSVNESGNYYYFSGHNGGGVMSQNVASVGPAGESSAGFAPGQITVNATVAISFELE